MAEVPAELAARLASLATGRRGLVFYHGNDLVTRNVLDVELARIRARLTELEGTTDAVRAGEQWELICRADEVIRDRDGLGRRWLYLTRADILAAPWERNSGPGKIVLPPGIDPPAGWVAVPDLGQRDIPYIPGRLDLTGRWDSQSPSCMHHGLMARHADGTWRCDQPEPSHRQTLLARMHDRQNSPAAERVTTTGTCRDCRTEGETLDGGRCVSCAELAELVRARAAAVPPAVPPAWFALHPRREWRALLAGFLAAGFLFLLTCTAVFLAELAGAR